MAGFFYSNMMSGLSDQGHPLSLSFLLNEAGFEISEGIDFDPSDTYLKAFWVGVVNTLRVSILGIICATVLGFIFGVARLSTNWLIRSIAAVVRRDISQRSAAATDFVLVCHHTFATKNPREYHNC